MCIYIYIYIDIDIDIDITCVQARGPAGGGRDARREVLAAGRHAQGGANDNNNKNNDDDDNDNTNTSNENYITSHKHIYATHTN